MRGKGTEPSSRALSTAPQHQHPQHRSASGSRASAIHTRQKPPEAPQQCHVQGNPYTRPCPHRMETDPKPAWRHGGKSCSNQSPFIQKNSAGRTSPAPAARGVGTRAGITERPRGPPGSSTGHGTDPGLEGTDPARGGTDPKAQVWSRPCPQPASPFPVPPQPSLTQILLELHVGAGQGPL